MTLVPDVSTWGRYSGTKCTLHAETMEWLLTLFGYPVTITEGKSAVFSS